MFEIFASVVWFTIMLVTSKPIIEEDSAGMYYIHLGDQIFGNQTKKARNREGGGATIHTREGDSLLPRARAGVKTKRWPTRIVPYQINGNFSAAATNMIKKAVLRFNKRTCVRFRPSTQTDLDYVSIESNNTGCHSAAGHVGGKQVINLQAGCFIKIGKVMHEFMHAIGFLHEQSRYDRDEFVLIVSENIEEGRESAFKKTKKGECAEFDVPYDYGSLMHYGSNMFSKNGEATIVPKKPAQALKMGQREDFSEGDLRRINLLYGCGTKQTASPIQAKQRRSKD